MKKQCQVILEPGPMILVSKFRGVEFSDACITYMSMIQLRIIRLNIENLFKACRRGRLLSEICVRMKYPT